MAEPSNDDFFHKLAGFNRFEGVTDSGNYRPLPDDWLIAIADIVSSTKAIAAGHYKSVNMAGASVISAVLNALDRGDYPFAFGGDGALVAVPPSGEERARRALAAVRGWVMAELQLELRTALVPLNAIRGEGLDVRVARFNPSDHVSYAMFSGGGTSWAERQMKAGRFIVEPLSATVEPDLTGLSCRWNPIEAQNGEIVSIIAIPGDEGNGPKFQQLVADIIAISAEQSRDSHPVPEEGPTPALIFEGVEMEARALASPANRWWRKLAIDAQIALVWLLDRFGVRTATFDAKIYRRDLAANSDFRKFDDGLKMTIDVDVSHLERIEARLRQAEADGVSRFGLHRQDSALMTCFVPTPLMRDHMHFIDGASGGYAMAALALRQKRPPALAAGT
ncbi:MULTISPECIES: DUF3095 domain-containing protein [unclassified Rhizobium]|jgi:hypothetical protein|uniref:DUF3095 domain-containing protein n=1 Tax=unclassified Rhizobium TaxID=2613769 RepID=UPI0006480F1E|nr:MULTISPECIES: DUF3095 domain-containing protein [unclassified Rhizobium]MBN8953054.1 DUF3095 domain-containing protein [Rhizobium tropici]OJY64621.1 MAG: adenylate cyclase [Rhizobium sp. 60-20]RKD72520.1 DUF3095 family protein [Rhizobium sp. WW_1]